MGVVREACALQGLPTSKPGCLLMRQQGSEVLPYNSDPDSNLGGVAFPTYCNSLKQVDRPHIPRCKSNLSIRMANRGYDVVVDIDDEVRPENTLT